MMVPVGRLVLLRSVAKADLVAAMAWLTAPALIGPVVGPPLGGLLVTYADWRWIFYINVPIGLLGIVLVTRFVENVRDVVPKRLDLRGLLLSAVALAALMFGFEMLGRGILPPLLSIALIGTGALAAAGYGWHARRTPMPCFDLGLLRISTFGVSVLAGSLFRIGVGAVPFLLPLMLQLGFGNSAAESGFITFAGSIGAIAMKPAVQFALRRFGFRSTLVWNGAVSAILLGACAAFRPTWPGCHHLHRSHCRRLSPVVAVYGLQHDRLCRYPAGSDECRDQSLCDRPAALIDHGDHRRRHGARGIDRSRSSCRPGAGRFLGRVLGRCRPGARGVPDLAYASPRCRGGTERPQARLVRVMRPAGRWRAGRSSSGARIAPPSRRVG